MNAQLAGITYKINESDKTAEVSKIDESLIKVVIPRTIKYNSSNYVVISVLKDALNSTRNLKSIKFQLFSQVRLFDYLSFANTSIEKITIPSSVTEIKGGWCREAFNLKKIKIMASNPRYSLLDKKIIIGKSNIEQKKHDTIVFAMNNIEYVKIPNYIKIIGTCAFENCKQIKNFEFLQNSILETIENFAFNGSSIQSIQVPDTVTEIGMYAFSICENLEKVDFSNSKIQSIEKFVFESASIVNLSIPASVTVIKEYAFSNTKNLRSIEVPSNSQLKKIEANAFNRSSIERFTIPSKFEILEKEWNINAPNISNLSVISDNLNFSVYENKFLLTKSSKEQKVFDVLLLYFGKDENVLIPDFVEIICELAFNECKQIRKVETSVNSKLKTIESSAFFNTSIESIILPSSLTKLQERWCFNSPNLKEIKVMPNNPIFSTCNNNEVLLKKSSNSKENYDVLVFAIQNIDALKILDDIEIISPFAFFNCNKLKTVDFSPESKLRIIGDFSFFKLNIEYISIPSHVTTIGQFAFSECEHIKNFEIPSNSELEIIDEYAFSKSSIEKFFIPSSLKTICKFSFIYCSQLKFVSIPENSNLQKIDSLAFESTSITSFYCPKKLENIDFDMLISCSCLQIIEFNEILDIKNYSSLFDQFQNSIIIMVPKK